MRLLILQYCSSSLQQAQRQRWDLDQMEPRIPRETPLRPATPVRSARHVRAAPAVPGKHWGWAGRQRRRLTTSASICRGCCSLRVGELHLSPSSAAYGKTTSRWCKQADAADINTLRARHHHYVRITVFATSDTCWCWLHPQRMIK